MVEVSAKVVGVSEVEEQLKALARKIPFVTIDAMRKSAALVERQIKENLTGGSPLQVQTGTLRASYSSRVFNVSSGVRGVVGSPVQYAAIHEHGGRITPKRARALTVPIAPETKRRKASDFPGMFVWKHHEGEGGAYLVLPTPGGGFKLMFQLRRSVFIPPRRYVSQALRTTGPKVVALVGNKIGQTVQGRG
jgi:phage gpG-like protein